MPELTTNNMGEYMCWMKDFYLRNLEMPADFHRLGKPLEAWKAGHLLHKMHGWLTQWGYRVPYFNWV
jgi:hypothetical protein